MTKMEKLSAFSRRQILQGAGALVVSIGMPVGLDTVLAVNSASAQGARPPLVPNELDSYIAVNADGTISAFFGKMDMGQGLYVSIGQMIAEELDVAFERVTVYMADTRRYGFDVQGSIGIKVGVSQARALFLSGSRFDAQRALRIGLVHEVHPDDEALDAAVERVTSELLTAAPLAVAHAKQLLATVAGHDPASRRRQTAEAIAERRASPEGQEGLRAFLERREPGWRG